MRAQTRKWKVTESMRDEIYRRTIIWDSAYEIAKDLKLNETTITYHRKDMGIHKDNWL